MLFIHFLPQSFLVTISLLLRSFLDLLKLMSVLLIEQQLVR
ncbi:hypothetical protein JCM19233_2427 [Vibrio astriarenae]|nr:hypothetical protein JCM19233_2427 [Vibrio sp. C7]